MAHDEHGSRHDSRRRLAFRDAGPGPERRPGDRTAVCPSRHQAQRLGAVRQASTDAVEGCLESRIHETLERLDRIEPLLPGEVSRENRAGMLEVLAWQESPKARVVCDRNGDLSLESVKIAAGQLIELPRLLDVSDEPDPGPETQLTEFFARVRASLMAWMQAVDHLRPR